jgi:hypothetical protein
MGMKFIQAPQGRRLDRAARIIALEPKRHIRARGHGQERRRAPAISPRSEKIAIDGVCVEFVLRKQLPFSNKSILPRGANSRPSASAADPASRDIFSNEFL